MMTAHALAERPVVQVAVGVLVQADGQFLMTSRPSGKVYEGYWEFPGGKIEAGETLQDALARELAEELGIVVQTLKPWRTLEVHYPHARVLLNFCLVTQWQGALEMKEQQAFAWQRLPVTVAPVLPGSLPVLEWLAEPSLQAALAM
jgi:8-oxo-dGTP diphosphatase